MNIIVKGNADNRIEVGDIVGYDFRDGLYIVGYDPFRGDCSYFLVSLHTGNSLAAFGSLDALEGDSTLICKNKNTTVILEGASNE